MPTLVIGLDYGTLSGRAVLMDAEDGRVLAAAEKPYPHGVMAERLPDGDMLPMDWALQHPQDWLDVLTTTIPQVIRASGANPADVRAIGLDVTANTYLPVTEDGTPLCFLPQWSQHRHAWPKLWKHHAAQRQADRLTEAAQARSEAFLPYYGGKISPEWMLPKLLQMLEEDPACYHAMAHAVEAADFLVWQLTGVQTRNSCAAGYKSLYRAGIGYPSPDYFAAVNPAFRSVISEKLSCPVTETGREAGRLTAAMAAQLGLLPGVSVAIGNVDAHMGLPACGIDGAGRLLAIIGTSTCHITMAEETLQVPGICGVVQGGVLPGYAAYEAGQSAVGDLFAWLTTRFVPQSYHDAARAAGQTLHQYMTALAARQQPGAHGLIALDWWNGCRSILSNADLTGLLVGMTLQTTPEDIYRALLESTAYGTRTIVENFRSHGVPVTALDATGGISLKNPLMMQIYADVLNMPVRVSGAAQGPAQGSAIFAAVAARLFADFPSAIAVMGAKPVAVYQPNPDAARVYDALYAEYSRLHDFFGRETSCMKQLKGIKAQAAAR